MCVVGPLSSSMCAVTTHTCSTSPSWLCFFFFLTRWFRVRNRTWRVDTSVGYRSCKHHERQPVKKLSSAVVRSHNAAPEDVGIAAMKLKKISSGFFLKKRGGKGLGCFFCKGPAAAGKKKRPKKPLHQLFKRPTPSN